MGDERELYRTVLTSFHSQNYAVCILTSRRILIKWDYGTVNQYFLGEIRSVRASDLNKKVRKRFSRKSDPATIEIYFNNGSYIILHAESRQLATQIQNSLMPF